MDGQDWNSELIDCQMVSVVDYFCFVFGGDFWEEAKEVFKHAFVNFSHWVSMDGNISIPKSSDDQLGADEWTLRHWHRTSAVQCCHNQHLVDKMIPIYFKEGHSFHKDRSCVSQIFISDRVWSRTHKQELKNITRHDDSINCHSSRPWVAILVDMALQESAVEVNFVVKQPNRPTTQHVFDSPCLFIYAAAINGDTFPFLSRSKRLQLTLQNIINHDKSPPLGGQLMQILQEQVRYGSTSTGRHMTWETWAATLELCRQ
ncbi:hypothetical protein EDC04DRAFT_669446 [Pisolithus marmoratus]|nr:hypothetical protein EDC04DRAFT_669446 [Pisolithus marmoratus]